MEQQLEDGAECDSTVTGVKARGMYVESNRSQDTTGEPFHHSSSEQKQIRCANCDIDILWPPTVVQGKIYCCTGCAAGGPCSCDYSLYRSVTISGVIHYGTDLPGQPETEQRSEQS